MIELRFDGRVVVITGGGRGLGATYAKLLADKTPRSSAIFLTASPWRSQR